MQHSVSSNAWFEVLDWCSMIGSFLMASALSPSDWEENVEVWDGAWGVWWVWKSQREQRKSAVKRMMTVKMATKKRSLWPLTWSGSSSGLKVQSNVLMLGFDMEDTVVVAAENGGGGVWRKWVSEGSGVLFLSGWWVVLWERVNI